MIMIMQRLCGQGDLLLCVCVCLAKHQILMELSVLKPYGCGYVRNLNKKVSVTGGALPAE